jgi:hypothetical protein
LLIEDKTWERVCTDLTEGDFPKQLLRRKPKENKSEKITLHRVEDTPNGDGSIKLEEGRISIDRGLLCLAETPSNWSSEKVGICCLTLEEAQKVFSNAMKALDETDDD